jgi:hypothetical protein
VGLRCRVRRARGQPRGDLAADVADLATSLLLCGVDPLPTLSTAGPVELSVLSRALQRTAELRQEELHTLARLIRNEIGELIGAKKRSG